MTDFLPLALAGDRAAAHVALYRYNQHLKWSAETFRARWDGTSHFLDWWQGLDRLKQPALEKFRAEDARAFLTWLEQKGLARSTLKGYREGARAFLKALHYAKTKDINAKVYDPFCDAPLPPKPRPPLNPSPAALIAITNPRIKARLELLLALLELGFSVPEACSRCWEHLILQGAYLEGYRSRHVRLSRRALNALENVKPYRYITKGWEPLLNWKADTARRQLKRLGMAPRSH